MQARTKHHYLPIFLIPLALLTVLLAGCGGDGGGGDSTPTESTVAVSWDANRESGVNSSGGGYRVYHSTTSGFDIGSADFVDVPYVSGSSAPTSTELTLSSGTHYIKVVAYSALNPSGSAPSDENVVYVF
ncbi:MAG: hypothetical protein ACLFQT_09210 [Thiohalophilus sp.]